MQTTITQYGWESGEEPISCSYIAPTILAQLAAVGAKRVLDLGSGNGALCKLMRSAGYDVVGVERDAEGVSISKAGCREVNFYNFSIEAGPAALLERESKFDAVISTEVIEHLYAPHLLVEYARQVLKTSGSLILTTPYHGYLKNLVLSLLDKWDTHHTVLWHHGHIKFWSPTTLSKLLEDNGFQVTGFAGVGRVPYLWKSMVISAKRT